ncbi:MULTISPECIES: flagellar basal body L-ring protein FlgH [Gammaproteobacteria]|uniref:flagellar basal body L-ring protein FlgH n=1 Tax=Gammaproteobacteria TaxID=1236 RepID=UPI000DCFFD7A|nr:MULTISPECIES: flagellar basal body L-ring protein FlgH [Gammaproteobacteria]RTE86159.1 flagellar basal body L-ring protein FlgH [Aliidiomarina sp. B3213]TCZ91769.1 flagellar basal body L-ring protein FlgH [Lysobacter sp. N42]
MRILKLMSACCLAMSLLACASSPQPRPMPDDPYYAPANPEPVVEPATPNGSLFNGPENSLYSDIKARDIGDIITVQLQESTSASKSATTDLARATNVNLPTPTIAGQELTFRDYSLSASLDGSSSFEGDSSADQSNTLEGDITVTVIRVLPNGNLIVRGEKWLTLNNGEEYIRLTGIIRPQDVSSENTVLSNRVANARIEYSGTGSLADNQRQGWLTRFFNGPWWPF